MCNHIEGRGLQKIPPHGSYKPGGMISQQRWLTAYPTLPALAVKVAPQLDTSLDLDVNRVCKPSCSSSSSLPLSRPSRMKRRADALLKATLFPRRRAVRAPRGSSTPRTGCPAPSAQLYGDLAAACVYYCRASINSPLMGRCVIDSREGVATSSRLELAGGMTGGDHRADVSLIICAASGIPH